MDRRISKMEDHIEARVEERVEERLEEELAQFLDALETKLPPDAFRQVMEIAAAMDQEGDDGS